jgi:hypothetical protein
MARNGIVSNPSWCQKHCGCEPKANLNVNTPEKLQTRKLGEELGLSRNEVTTDGSCLQTEQAGDSCELAK